MIVNGVIVSKPNNEIKVGEGLKVVKRANGLKAVKGSGSNVKISNVKKYGSGLRILE